MSINLIEKEINGRLENDLDKFYDKMIVEVERAGIPGLAKESLRDILLISSIIRLMQRHEYFTRTAKDTRRARIEHLLDTVKLTLYQKEKG